MTKLKERMLQDLQLRGYAERTQQMYTRAVRKLAEHYGKSPDQITEEELLRQFAENTDLFVNIPPKTAGYIRKAAKGQRRAAHRLVEQVLQKGFSRFDWH